MQASESRPMGTQHGNVQSENMHVDANRICISCRRTVDNARGFFNDELTKQKLDLKEGFDFGHRPRPDLADDDTANT